MPPAPRKDARCVTGAGMRGPAAAASPTGETPTAMQQAMLMQQQQAAMRQQAQQMTQEKFNALSPQQQQSFMQYQFSQMSPQQQQAYMQQQQMRQQQMQAQQQQQAAQKLTPQQQAAMHQHLYQQQQQRFAMANGGMAPSVRPGRGRDRNAGVITEEEWEAGVEKHADSGKGFRRLFWIFVFVCIFFLAFAKYDVELGMDLPPELQKLAERDAELRGDTKVASKKKADVEAAAAAAAAAAPTNAATEDAEAAAQLEEGFKALNIDVAELMTPEELKLKALEEIEKKKAEATSAKERAALDTDDAFLNALREQRKLERLDLFRKKQQLKENFNRHQESYGQLVACGSSCQQEHKQMQLAYDTINSKVDTELFGLLLDENVVQTGRSSVDPEQLTEAFLKKKEQIETSTEDEEVKSMELAEIKDAYDILLNVETRAYYRLTGRKPPEHMKKTSTRHGGWGQELLLRTHKNRLILAWLDYFDGPYADWAVLGIIGLIGFVLPVALQLPRIIEMAQEIEERQIQMEEMEKRVAAGGSAVAPPEEAESADTPLE